MASRSTKNTYSDRMVSEVTRIANNLGMNPSELLDVKRDSQLRAKLGRPIEPEDYPWALDDMTAFTSKLSSRYRKYNQ